MMQKNSFEISPAREEDAAKLAELEKLCFSVPWSEKALLETMSGENALFLAARLDGELCGYIGSYSVLDEGYITNVAVSPSFRRRGIGKALVLALSEKAEEKELSFLTLEVRETNSAAISLYEKLGFEKEGRRPRFYSNPTEDAYIMTRYLRKEVKR